MREQLIRYLLGELDEFERRELRAKLQSSPELQRELARLRECFAENQGAEAAPGPPGRLAERTAERVTSCDDDVSEWMSSSSKGLAPASDPPAGVLGWSLADLAVAFGVMLAVSMLVFPALRDSRESTRRIGCQDHLRYLTMLVSRFALDHGSYLPPVGPNENAGVFAALLVKKGYVEPEDLAVVLMCPSAPLANEIRAGTLSIKIPAREVLRAMSPSQLAQVTATMSPFYAYRLPYRVGDDYHYIRDERRALSPVFSDTSGDLLYALGSNHGGSIIQVASQDGSVRSFTSCTLPGFNDELFHNDLGVMAAGIGPLDVVLGRSDATPGLEFAALDLPR